MKIIFVGHPGSGKTYASTLLANKTHIELIDIDSLLENPINFCFKRPYRKALLALLAGKTSWIMDGYAGKRMPPCLWDEADHIVYINLPQSELKINVYARYKRKHAARERTHGQHLFANVIKNIWQIYILDRSLKNFIFQLKLTKNSTKLTEVKSRKELDDVLDKFIQLYQLSL